MESTVNTRELIRMAGGPVAVGRLFNISGQAVSGWYAEGIPPDRVIRVAESTGWSITPHQLRPDIYPNPCDGLPPDHPLRLEISKKAA